MKILVLMMAWLTATSGLSAPKKAEETSTLSSLLSSFVGDPGSYGKYAVYKKDVKIPVSKGEDAAVYAPSLDGGKSMVPMGQFPLVVVLPGFGATFTYYEDMIQHLVSWGFVAIGIDFVHSSDHGASAKQAQQTIDWALTLANPAAAIIDPAKIAVAGHSMGGKIAVYASAGESNPKYPAIQFPGDPRIKVIIAWDPVDGGPPCIVSDGEGPGRCRGYAVLPDNIRRSRAKLLIFGGITGDPTGITCTPAGRTHADFFAAAASSALHVDFPGSGHADWLNQKQYFGLLPKVANVICGSRPTSDPGRVQALARRTQVAWLLKYLGGVGGLDPYLTGALIRADCAKDGLCRVESKLLD
jgi:pimeloyl-ACP methyl ester carboxylesterase